MRITLFVAALVMIAVVAVVWFPPSPVAYAAGWVLYIGLGVLVQPWGMAALGVGASIAAIWWTLTRRRALRQRP